MHGSAAARTAAESASELAQDTYERGARYVRDGLGRFPEAGRYIREGGRAVSRPLERYPLTAVLLFGAFGYFVGYLHGSRWQWNRESVPDYARRPAYSDRSRGAATSTTVIGSLKAVELSRGLLVR